MLQNIDNYYDDQFGSAFDEMAGIFNLRKTLSEQVLSSAHNIHTTDQRIQRISKYLLRKPDMMQDITLDILQESEEIGVGDISDVFASALLAFASEDESWIARIVNGYLEQGEYSDGLVYALAWLPWKISAPWISRFLSSKDLDHKWLAVNVCAMLGRFPQEQLRQLMNREDCQQHTRLFERLVYMAGQLQDDEVHPILRDASEHEEIKIQSVAFWARWMMNDRNVADHIQQFSLQGNLQFDQLSPYIILRLDISAAKQYLASALKTQDLAEDLIINAIAAHGDASTLSWLIQKIDNPALFPWLGLAFFQITGITLDQASLLMEPEPDLDELDDSAGYLLQDMSLPYPDKEKLLAMTQHVTRGLNANTRYFLGNPVDDPEQFVSLYQNHHIGLTRKFASMHAAFCGQHYIPYKFLPPLHLDEKHKHWPGV